MTAWSFIREKTWAASQGESAGMQSREACQQRRSFQNTMFPPLPYQETSDSCVGTLGHKNSPQPSAARFASGSGISCLCPLGNIKDFTAENLLSSASCLAGEKKRTPHATSNVCLSESTVQVLKVNIRAATVKTDISQGDGQWLPHRAEGLPHKASP